MDSAHPDTVNSRLSEDELFGLGVKWAADVETPVLALRELVSLQEERGHAQAERTVCS